VWRNCIVVKIRLKRTGRTNQPSYRIVVQDIHERRDGPQIEILGSYSPLKKTDNVVVKADRVQAWLSKGAQPTQRVAILLKKAGVKVS
jgi:small subunit ribosomal protein S16